ncbi:hypothetical protein BMS3Abin04_02741 [bacterium BMS3Abin04]|nr:hypothetical protein BMS3Abin04_02741 [bacterium BMS3Abin04]
MNNLQKFKRIEKQLDNSFSANFKNLFLSPIFHGLLAAIVFLSTALVIRMFFIKSSTISGFFINPNELILSLLAGATIFSISLRNKIKDYSIR